MRARSIPPSAHTRRPAAHRPLRAALAATLCLLALPGATGASAVAFDPPPTSIDTRGSDHRITGAAPGDAAGWDLATGDVNGDGAQDVVVGTQADRAYVLFGELPFSVDLSLFPATGFTIVGTGVGTRFEVVGDVDGDGREDILARHPSNGYALVFGKGTSDTVDARAPGGAGYHAIGRAGGNGDIARGGSVRRDPWGDYLVVDSIDGVDGKGYVVFGSGDTATLDLASLGDRGYRIRGARITQMAWAGDVNGDGMDDQLVANEYDDGGARDTGAVWVVFGKGDSFPVDLRDLEGFGYRIEGVAEYDSVGASIANAGDVNGDGVPDQLIGGSEAVYVVYGQRTSSDTIRLSHGAFSGYTIVGEWLHSSPSVAGNVDVNGDGRPDQLIGSEYATTGSRTASGAAFVVHGRQSRSVVELELLAADEGFRLEGPNPETRFGHRVAFLPAAGAIQLLVGAPQANPLSREDAGAVIVEDRPASAPRLPIAEVELRTRTSRFVATAAGGGRPTVSFRALEPLRVRATLFRLLAGKRVGAERRCVAPATPAKRQRACVTARRTARTSFSVRPGRVERQLDASFAAGRYLVTLDVTTTDGRTFGPFRARFRVAD